jgi:hypothetical protein
MESGSNFRASLELVCAQGVDVGNVAAMHASFSADKSIAEDNATCWQRLK